MFRPTCLKGRLHKISAVHTTACLIRLCCRSCRHVLAASLLVPAWTAPAAAGLNQPYGDRGVSGARHRGRRAGTLRVAVIRHLELDEFAVGRLLQAPKQVVVLQLEYVLLSVVVVQFYPGFLRGQTGLCGLLFADKSRPR